MKKYVINLFVVCSLLVSMPYLRADSMNQSSNNLMIRELERSDFDKMQKLFEDNSDISSLTGMASYSITAYFGIKSTKVYVCVDLLSEKIVGFALAYESGASFYIRALGVDKDYRRFGVATKLLKEIYGFVSDQNSCKQLSIHASNDNAKKCYEKFGFKYDALIGALVLKI